MTAASTRSVRALVLDFDGTVTTADIGDLVCSRFAPTTWREVDDLWVRGQLSLPEAQKRMWALARATRGEAEAFVAASAKLRPGLDALLDAALREGIPIWLASGGFDFYIEPLLGERLHRLDRRYYNRARFDGDRISVEFPHPELSCARCAVCKGKVCDLARALGGDVLFVGDGHSDRCVLGRADRIAAVRGSVLARHLAAEGEPAIEFERLDELCDQL